MKRCIYVVLVVLTLLPLTSLVGAQEALAEIDGGEGIIMTVQTFQSLNQAGREKPRQDEFLVMYMMLKNTTRSEQCVYARDIRLWADEESYAPERYAMSAVQDLMKTSEKRDYVGPMSGHCVPAGRTVPSFAVFDVPASLDVYTITFNDAWIDFENGVAIEINSSPADEILDSSNDSSLEESATTNDTSIASDEANLRVAVESTGIYIATLTVFDGRPNGGERGAIIGYYADASTDTEQEMIEEWIMLFGAVAGAIRVTDMNLDSVTLLVGTNEGTPVGTVTAQASDLMKMLNNQITPDTFFQRLEIVSF